MVVYLLLRSVDNYQVEVLLSLALVAGRVRRWPTRLHMSGPIAMVVAGLLIGNLGRAYAMSPTTVEHLDTFWELVDEILNAVLFVLIGLEVLVLAFTADVPAGRAAGDPGGAPGPAGVGGRPGRPAAAARGRFAPAHGPRS